MFLMKFSLKHFTAAAMIATAGMASYAQPAPGGPQMDPAKRAEFVAKRAEHMAKRQAELKQKLGITSAQESAWTSFTNAMKPGERKARMDRDAFAKLSTPDRIDQMKSLRNTRIAEMDRRADATKAFYAVLTPAQKTVFDTETAKKRGGHGGHGGQGGHGHGHRG
jgi:protein CpxP